MMKQNQLLSLAFVVACGFTSNVIAGETDRYKTHSGAECEKTYDSGVELSAEAVPNTLTGDVDTRFMVTLTIPFGGGGFNSGRIDCRQTMLHEQDRMYLENERLRLELELLRRKVEGVPEAGQASAEATLTDGDDW